MDEEVIERAEEIIPAIDEFMSKFHGKESSNLLCALSFMMAEVICQSLPDDREAFDDAKQAMEAIANRILEGIVMRKGWYDA
jgi:hypothetical protein